jgi:glycosyltransferase involved in cell wall biosynthesis
MHDTQEYHFPEFFSSSERLHRAINSKKGLEDSDHIIVSFEHIKKDIIKYFHINDEKISVCPPPFHTSWFSEKEFSSREDLEKKYGVDKKFLLYPAATWQHKNHRLLIDALKNLEVRGLQLQLICTGNKTEYFEVLQTFINKYNLSHKIKFLGIVPEKDLIGLYKATSLVIIPTLYEAGSGPLYEAMRYGTPVISSDVTSLPETMSNSNFLFNPDNVNALSDQIEKMLRDDSFKEENILNSKKRIEFLGKQNYINNFLDAFRKAEINEK